MRLVDSHFFLFKDLDIPFQFWGEGEVKWLTISTATN